jgi:hypothetical protein
MMQFHRLAREVRSEVERLRLKRQNQESEITQVLLSRVTFSAPGHGFRRALLSGEATRKAAAASAPF